MTPDPTKNSPTGTTTPTPCSPDKDTPTPYPGHHPMCWCEVDTDALRKNMAQFRRMVGQNTKLAAVIKSNAYGHGLLPSARAFLDGGADWLCVHDLDEARTLRDQGVTAPIYLLGPILPWDAAAAVHLDVRVVLHSRELLRALCACATEDKPVRVHLKLETGNNRQGLLPADALALATEAASMPNVVVEGVTSHYANIEDTTDQTFARLQLTRFREFLQELHSRGIKAPLSNFSNSAATILWPDTWFGMTRVGIAAYGMWPSKETMVTAVLAGRHQAITLKPALAWKTRITQIKNVNTGEYVGYGCSYRTTHPIRLGVIPVGYRDGFDRRLSNLAHVQVNGSIAPVRGRVCMNMTMIDVTHAGNVNVGDQVLLLGPGIPAEKMAEWAGTINYEITTRIADHIPRIPVQSHT